MEAIWQICSGLAISVGAKVLGIPNASLRNWLRLAGKGALEVGVGDTKAPKVTAEQMEITRLWAYVRR